MRFFNSTLKKYSACHSEATPETGRPLRTDLTSRSGRSPVNRRARNAEHDQWSEALRDPALAVATAGTAMTVTMLTGIETTMTASAGTGTTRTRTMAGESVTAVPIEVEAMSGF